MLPNRIVVLAGEALGLVAVECKEVVWQRGSHDGSFGRLLGQARRTPEPAFEKPVDGLHAAFVAFLPVRVGEVEVRLV